MFDDEKCDKPCLETAEEVETPEIVKQLNTIESIIHDVERNITKLEERLSPLCIPNSLPENEACKEPTGKTELGSYLIKRKMSLINVLGRLESLNRRIEL